MESLTIGLQVIIALTLANVWLVRYSKATAWRGGEAGNMKQEFEVYGLPGWFVPVIGSLKLLCAAMLIAGIWYPSLTRPAAAAVTVLMIGAVAMHVKVKDPIKKSAPAFILLLLALIVAL